MKRYLTGSDSNDTTASEEPRQKSPTTSNIPVAINTHVVNVELEQLHGQCPLDIGQIKFVMEASESILKLRKQTRLCKVCEKEGDRINICNDSH